MTFYLQSFCGHMFPFNSLTAVGYLATRSQKVPLVVGLMSKITIVKILFIIIVSIFPLFSIKLLTVGTSETLLMAGSFSLGQPLVLWQSTVVCLGSLLAVMA